MTWGNRVDEVVEPGHQHVAGAVDVPAADARSASARAASGQSHSHSVGRHARRGGPGDRGLVRALGVACAEPDLSRGPRRTGTRGSPRSRRTARRPWPGGPRPRAAAPGAWRAARRPAGRTRPRPHRGRTERDPQPVGAPLPVPGPQQPAPLPDGHPGEVRVRSAEARELPPPFLQAGRPVGPRRRSGGVGLPQRARGRSPTSRAPPPRLRRPGPPVRLRQGGWRTPRPWLPRRRRTPSTAGDRWPPPARGRLATASCASGSSAQSDACATSARAYAVLPRVGPGRREGSGAPHRLHPQEAAPGREAQVLQPHEELGDEQRVVRLVDLREQGLDGAVLRLVVTEPCRGLPQPGQECLTRLPRPRPTRAVEVDEPTQEHAGGPGRRRAGRRGRPPAGSSGTRRGGARHERGARRPPRWRRVRRLVCASVPARSSSQQGCEGGVQRGGVPPRPGRSRAPRPGGGGGTSSRHRVTRRGPPASTASRSSRAVSVAAVPARSTARSRAGPSAGSPPIATARTSWRASTDRPCQERSTAPRRSSGISGPRCRASGEHPLDEQPVEVRVPTGPGVHVGDERLVGRGAEQGVQLVAGLTAVEGRERQLGEGRHPADVGQPPLHVMARHRPRPVGG